MIGSLAVIALVQVASSGPYLPAPQVLHLCAPPADPIEDQATLERYGMDERDEYIRYFNDLNAYLLCLQKSQADIIQQSNVWHERYKEKFQGKLR